MYAWYLYFSASGDLVDGGIWQSMNGGVSWSSISTSGIENCGDSYGCRALQGTYNLELLATPDGGGTDLYAGAINLYKCQLSSVNPTCAASPFINLTHVYGCVPVAAPSHVHPDQHALAGMIPSSGSDSGNALLYFANDGGIYRALDGFHGLVSGACSGTNQFDDLNQNLGSMAQFVSFSQHPSDPNTLLGGTQDNGSPATSQATTNPSWTNVLGGDGGYNAIDPIQTSNFYASNPDIPPEGLGIQFCSYGASCNNARFSYVVTSSELNGDDGAFYFPYILDPGSSTSMLIGTCRVWRGPRSGGVFTAVSPNFDTLGSATCSGSEVNQVRALAAAGQIDSNGSGTIYATTSGFGPLAGPAYSPAGGRVWVTTNASAGPATFLDVTENGPQGNINPNQFPISSVAIDPSDVSGNTAYVTVMGFTGGTGHVWKTTNAGASWTDFTANLPDSPANAVVVYAPMSKVFVGTDVGVFGSSTSAASWTELGPIPGPTSYGFLPNVAVTALGVFNSGGQQLLRASTYGRGIWQFNLVVTPDFQLTVSNSPLTVNVGQTATFNGTASGLNGYSSSVTLSCTAGLTPPPGTCTPAPSPLTPGIKTSFTVTAGGTVGDYYFNVQGVGSDSKQVTHQASAVLHVLSNSPDFTLSETGSFPTVNVGSTTTSGPISVGATTGFTGTINLTCTLVSGSGNCSVSPTAVTSIPTTANVTVNATNLSVGSYQLLVQGVSGATSHTLLIPFNVGDYQLSGTQALTVAVGAHGTANLSITASTYYAGKINTNCDASSIPSATCTLNQANPIVVNVGSTASFTATVNVPGNAAPGTYNVKVNTQDTTGAPSHSFNISLTVLQNFQVAPSPPTQTVTEGQTSAPYVLAIQPIGASFSGPVTLSCSSGLPAGAQCLFSPSAPQTPPANVAMTISTSLPTSAGTYPVTVTGTSGSLSNSVPLSLTVSNDFQLAASFGFPANVEAHSSQTAMVSVIPNYSGLINASCIVPSAMSGAQCAVTPSNPVAISVNVPAPLTLTLNIPINTPPGAYNVGLSVVDSSGQPSHILYLPLTVQDFSVASAPLSQGIVAGQTTSPYQLTLAPNPPGSSFPGAVTLSCPNGLPSGALCLFSPSTPQTPPANVVMTISTPASTSAGAYPVTVTGTSGPLSHSAAVSLTVEDFSVASAPLSQSAIAGQTTGPYQLILASIPSGSSYPGAVTLSCPSGLPSGAQCNFTPSTPQTPPASAVMTISTSASTSAGTYPVTVTGTSGSVSHSVALSLTVEDFSIAASPLSQSVNAGQTTGLYQLILAIPSGSSFPGAVTLSCPSGLPSGAQCLFSPSTPQTPPASVAMTISTIASTSVGTYPVTVTGTSGPFSNSAGVSLIVTGNVVSNDFQLALTQAFPANVTAGAPQTAKVSVTPNYSGSVNITCDDSAMSGAQCSVTPASPVAISANVAATLTVTLNVPNSAPPGAYNINLVVSDAGPSGQPSHTLQLPLTVIPDFSVSSATPSQTVTAGQTSGPYALTVQPVGSSFNGAVTLACSAGLPAGAQCIFNPSTPVTPGNSAVDVVMNISTKASSVRLETPVKGDVPPPAMWLPVAAMMIGVSASGNRTATRMRQLLSCVVFCLTIMGLVSCAGVSSGGGGGGQPPPPVTYHITVTGTSSGTPPDAGHSTSVALIVN